MKNKCFILITVIVILMNTIPACVDYVNENTLQSISYNNFKKESEYTVMIKEQGEYVPYLVITDSYDDGENCLLLRKYLLDEYMRYGESHQFNPSYYGCSELGAYLNDEFIKLFSNDMQAIIIDSPVEISTYDSISCLTEEMEYINRKVFLLSYYEMNFDYNRTKNLEGTSIDYFNSVERRIAYNENGEKGEWWLRTPELRSESVVMGVTMNGEGAGCGISGGSFEYELGVRPAFCLPRDTKIVEVDGLYYIEADYNSLDVMNNAEDRRDMLYEDVLLPQMTTLVDKVPFEYKPEGYDVCIKPALAIEMEAHRDDEGHKYHTIIYSGNTADWDEVIFDINNNPDNEIYLDMDYWLPKKSEGGKDRYYYVFTADEINALVEHNIDCAYVGLGTCDMEKANWDTEEGILEYCELYGDGYVVK